MAFLKTKVLAAAFLTGVTGHEVADQLIPDEVQPATWEVAKHPSYETIDTLRHRYTAHYADPLDVYIARDESGAVTDFAFSSFAASVPQELRDETRPWRCERGENGAIELSNIFTGETMGYEKTRIVQPLFSDNVFCTAEHPRDGFIGVHGPRI